MGTRLYVPASATSTDSWRAPSSPSRLSTAQEHLPCFHQHSWAGYPGPALGMLARQLWAPWSACQPLQGTLSPPFRATPTFTNRDLTETMQTFQARWDAPPPLLCRQVGYGASLGFCGIPSQSLSPSHLPRPLWPSGFWPRRSRPRVLLVQPLTPQRSFFTRIALFWLEGGRQGVEGGDSV